MSRYHTNKKLSITRSHKPSLTEQSVANETDINVIIGRFAVSGTVPGPSRPPMSGDFSQLPTDLRGFIEMGQSLKRLKNSLPKELRSKPLQELLNLTPEAMNLILHPPAPQPANTGTTT